MRFRFSFQDGGRHWQLCWTVAGVVAFIWLSTAVADPPDHGLTFPTTDIAADAGGNFLMVAETGTGVVGLAPAGPGELSPPFLVSAPTSGVVTEPAIAVIAEGDGASEFVVVWQDSTTAFSPGSIRGRFLSFDFDSGEADLAEEFVIAPADGLTYRSAPDVAANGDGTFVVVWEEEHVTSGLVTETIEAARFRGGTALPLTLTTSEELLLSPRVSVAADGSFIVAWEQGFEIVAAQVDADGGVRPAAEVNLFNAGLQSRPGVAVTGPTADDFAAVWDSTPAGGGAGVFGRRFEAGIGGPEFQVNSFVAGDQKDADVAADPDGNFAAVWLDEERNLIGGQRFDDRGVYVEDEIEVSAGLDNERAFGRPRAALVPDGRLLVGWPDASGTARIRAVPPSDAYLACIADDSTLCPQSGRFRVDVEWRATVGGAGGERRAARAVPLSDASGYFWFSDADNVELVAKVLRACSREDPCYWVFVAGMTDLEVEVAVRDTASGLTALYSSPGGVPFAPILDTTSFASAKLRQAGVRASPRRGFERGGRLRFVPRPRDSDSGCEGGPGAICLHHERFRVDVSWTDFRGISGRGHGTRLTRDSGYFWFFDPSNIETFFKVLDGCGINNHFWFFGAGLTNLEVQVRVTDTQTGAAVTFENPPGVPFEPILDITAFAACREAESI